MSQGLPNAVIKAQVDYEDEYVNPLILDALRRNIPKESLQMIASLDEAPPNSPWLQYAAYESLDFERSLASRSCLINAYVIRKALIRKHFLSQVISAWCAKHPVTPLSRHFRPAVDFELDYAEFLDDALVEAFELRTSFERNEGKHARDREWWILKPSMSDRGQGIRLFSTEDELRGIFEAWEEDAPDSDEEDASQEPGDDDKDYILTSQLRHFLAQPYIDPPLLIPQAPFDNRKFHIRTYVVAHGALKVYVYQHMLALFASESYQPPWDMAEDGDSRSDGDAADALLRKLQNVHLTNTCVQNATQVGQQARPSPVHLLEDLPLDPSVHGQIQTQINTTTSELFKAALAYPTHFQPLPNSFEVFGLDFLVSHTHHSQEPGQEINVSLLEVNAFPDFAQTGEKLRDVVIRGLLDGIARQIIAPHFGVALLETTSDEQMSDLEDSVALRIVLDIDMRRA